jgi:hypothetical protein
MTEMPAGLPVAIALFVQAVAVAAPYGPAPPPAPTPVSSPAKDAARECTDGANKDPNSREIVVCAVRPQGYRLDPDVLAARRMKKQGDVGRARNPHESFANHDCATIGPMGCRGVPTINLIQVASTLATMGDRLSKGQEIGSLFVTDPHPSEYQLYLEAKKRREAEQADKAAKAKQAAAQAQSAPTQNPSGAAQAHP